MLPAMIDVADDQPSGKDSRPRKGRGKSRGKQVDISRIDRLPPHSLEAEQGVLGCILQSPNDSIGECLQVFKSGSDAFYDLRHRTIYEAVVEMYDGKVVIDLITLQQRLKDANQLQGVGGLVYLSELIDAVPSPINLSYYIKIVREKYVLRRMIATCSEVVGQAFEHEGAVDALLDEVEKEVLKISQERVEGGAKTIKELVTHAINQIEEFHQNDGGLTGIGTGFPDLDKMTSGLNGGEMVVLAARPSMGKTSLAMNIAESVCIDQKLPVGVFSLEMTAESLILRMICSRARVNLRDIRDGFLNERDFARLTHAAGELSNAPLFIDDTPGLSILQLRAKARRMVQQFGIRFFVIDYLQLLHSTAARADNRQQEIADISNGVKSLAKELDVPVIVLSQLNREMEREKNRKPRLSDLRESGSIEQDADLVILLYKPDVSSGDDDEAVRDVSDAHPVSLLIAKQRNGPTGEVPVTFMKGYTRFESMARVSAEDAQY